MSSRVAATRFNYGYSFLLSINTTSMSTSMSMSMSMSMFMSMFTVLSLV
jgi:hypothetical protein